MKKIIVYFLSILTASSFFGGCSKDNTEKFSVTFLQDGRENYVVELDEGEDLSAAEFPSIVEKEGYSARWSVEEITNINKNQVIHVEYLPNSYEITLDANNGETPTKKQITYNSNYTLATPTREGYTFISWSYAGIVLNNSGLWTIAKDITLSAKWGFEITFKAEGQDDIVLTYEEGETPNDADIPNVYQKAGYSVSWSVDTISDITRNATVSAVEVGNTYKVYYKLKNYETAPTGAKYDAEKAMYYVEATYGSYFAYPSTVLNDKNQYSYKKLVLADTDTAVSNGTFKYLNDITVEVLWSNNSFGDDWIGY